MAKVSRVNIAITGDSQGLKAATTAAQMDLARLNAAAAKTNRELKSLGTASTKVGGALNTLGVGGRGLSAIGGLAQVGAMGGMGLGLGVAGLALGAGAAGIGAVQALPDVRKRAASALQESESDQRRRIEEMGFSRMIAQQIVERTPTQGVGAGIGIGEAFAQGLATQGGSATEVLINELPKAIATEIGALIGGATLDQAGALGRSQMMSGDPMADANKAIGLMNQVPNWVMDLTRWISK